MTDGWLDDRRNDTPHATWHEQVAAAQLAPAERTRGQKTTMALSHSLAFTMIQAQQRYVEEHERYEREREEQAEKARAQSRKGRRRSPGHRGRPQTADVSRARSVPPPRPKSAFVRQVERRHAASGMPTEELLIATCGSPAAHDILAARRTTSPPPLPTSPNELLEVTDSMLRAIPLFSHLGRQQLQVLRAGAHVQRLPCNCTIYEAGWKSDSMFVLLHGCVELSGYRRRAEMIERFKITQHASSFGEEAARRPEPLVRLGNAHTRKVDRNLVLEIPCDVLSRALIRRARALRLETRRL